jgi:hypothetical protein
LDEKTGQDPDGKDLFRKHSIIGVEYEPENGGFVVRVNVRVPAGDYKVFSNRKSANRSCRTLWRELKKIPYSPDPESQFCKRISVWLLGSMSQTGGAENPGKPGIRKTPEWAAARAKRQAAWEAKRAKEQKGAAPVAGE